MIVIKNESKHIVVKLNRGLRTPDYSYLTGVIKKVLYNSLVQRGEEFCEVSEE